jgi:hypothetical protein
MWKSLKMTWMKKRSVRSRRKEQIEVIDINLEVIVEIEEISNILDESEGALQIFPPTTPPCAR